MVSACIDFMSVRRIPLKEYDYISDSPIQDEDLRSEDPTVSVALANIRRKLLTDRALHDQVHMLIIKANGGLI